MLIEADSQNALVPSIISRNQNTIYSSHYGFLRPPFSMRPNKNFFIEYQSALHMVNTVAFAIRSGESIVKVTGNSGVGKSFLLQQVFNSLGDDFYTVKVLAPNLSANVLLRSVVEDLGGVYPIEANDAQLIKYLQYLLYEHYTKSDCAVVIWIDDVHKLPTETLDIIVSLSKMETANRALVQFVLSGTFEFDLKLKSAPLTQLRERISFSSKLEGMRYFEFKNYIKQRLELVENLANCRFTLSALSLIFRKTAGIPRKINQLAHKSLMIAYGKGDLEVNHSHVFLALKDENIESRLPVYLHSLLFVLPISLAISFYWSWPIL